MKRNINGLFLVALFAALQTLRAAAPAHPAKPNILFIITDQQCADALSCRMGAQYLHTPALDSLAAQGMFFTRAYAANPLCMPSRNSMFTGRYPHETGVTANEFIKLDTVKFPSLGTYFHQAGYETAYFGKSHLCSKMAEQFDTSVLPKPKDDHDQRTLTGAVKFLNEPRQRPFFCVVSFMNPHNVCELARGQSLPNGSIGNPPPADQCPPAPANLAPQQNEPDAMTVMRKGYHANPMFPVGDFTTNDWRQLRWGYYRLIEKVDAQIGEVLDALRKSGQGTNTIIVFTSDHGECAGAHGFNQKTVLYEESVRVPLIVSFAGHTKHGDCDKLVNTGIDIMPTLLDLAGVPGPEQLPGRSLRPLALGKPVKDWRNYLVSEDDMDQAGPIDGFRPVAQGRMVRMEQFKYCVYNVGERRESLVDLKADPGEMKNLAGDPAYHRILLKCRALLANFAKEQNDPLAAAMLADGVKPIPFKFEAKLPSAGKKEQ